jgi:hypothetical protein
MNKILLMTAGLLLMPLPAWSQTASDSDRDSFMDKRDRDVDDLLRSITDEMGEGGRRGASFVLRNGNSTIAVRCDPRESMTTCVDLTTTLLERASRSAMPSGTAGPQTGAPPPGP